MNLWIFLTPFLSALIGWCFHFLCADYFFKKYLPRKKTQLISSLSKKAETLLPLSQIEHKITDPELIEKTMPLIETHIDEFLSVKLPQEIPMLAMFVGNKTTDKIKEVFMNQLRTLFPIIMSKLTSDLKNTIPAQAIVQSELEKMDIAAIINETIPNGRSKLGLLGLLLGFIIGVLNILMVYIFL